MRSQVAVASPAGLGRRVAGRRRGIFAASKVRGMSTAPRGSILFRYVPGVGKVAALECGTSPTATCATAYSTSSQSLTAGTAAAVRHDTAAFSYGITTTTGAGGSFTVPAAGVYKIIPSLQILGAGNGAINIWMKVNSSNVANTTTHSHFKQNDEMIITCEYLLELNAGDSIQVWALAENANCSIDYIAAGGSGANAYPAAPGVITNLYRIR